MATKPLQSIKFPGLEDTYTVPQVDSTLQVTGAAADAKKVGDELGTLNERLGDFDKISEVFNTQSFVESDWSVGTVQFSNGRLTPAATGTRAWMNDYLDEGTTQIVFDPNVNRIVLFVYSKSDVFESNTGWIASSPYNNFDFENHKYRLIVRKQPDGDITALEAIDAVELPTKNYNGSVEDVTDTLKRVTKTGKNIQISDAINAKVIACSGESAVTVSGYNLCTFESLSGVGNATSSFGGKLPAGTYTVTAKCVTNNPGVDVVEMYLGGFWGRISVSGDRVSRTYNITREVDAVLSVYANNSSSPLTDYSVTLSDIVISAGSTAMPYEPHFETKTYEPSELSEVILTEYTNNVTSESDFSITYVKKNGYIEALRSTFGDATNYYLQPEDFGAVGDGNSDDTVALNNCISQAIANGIPIRGYGKYKTTSPIQIIGDNVDLYLYRLVYIGTGDAVVFQGYNSMIQIDYIVSSGNGVRIKAETTNTHYNTFTFNDIYANYNGVVVYAYKNNYQNRLNFNRIRGGAEYSCILFVHDETSETGYLNEWHILGGLLTYSLWGIRGDLDVTIFVDVHTEGLGSTDNGGAIYSTSGKMPGIIYARSGEVQLRNTFLKISGVVQKFLMTRTPTQTIALEAIDITELEPADEIFMRSENIRLVTNFSIQKEKYSEQRLTNNLVLWGNRFQFPPIMYRVLDVQADVDMTDQYYADIIPQKFVADGVTARVDLHPTYAANCLSTFTVEQKNGGQLDIYDYCGHLIFDGSEYGNGRYNLTAYVSGMSVLYYDMSNQLWDIEKTS